MAWEGAGRGRWVVQGSLGEGCPWESDRVPVVTGFLSEEVVADCLLGRGPWGQRPEFPFPYTLGLQCLFMSLISHPWRQRTPSSHPSVLPSPMSWCSLQLLHFLPSPAPSPGLPAPSSLSSCHGPWSLYSGVPLRPALSRGCILSVSPTVSWDRPGTLQERARWTTYSLFMPLALPSRARSYLFFPNCPDSECTLFS